MDYDRSQVELIRMEAMATLPDAERISRGLAEIIRLAERLEGRISTRQKQTAPDAMSGAA